VEGVGSPAHPEWQKIKITHEAPTASGIREVEKSTFFLVKMGFSLPNWLFQQSFVVFNNLYTSPINLKCDNLLILARREF
jgi:hypothetical protein